MSGCADDGTPGRVGPPFVGGASAACRTAARLPGWGGGVTAGGGGIGPGIEPGMGPGIGRVSGPATCGGGAGGMVRGPDGIAGGTAPLVAGIGAPVRRAGRLVSGPAWPLRGPGAETGGGRSARAATGGGCAGAGAGGSLPFVEPFAAPLADWRCAPIFMVRRPIFFSDLATRRMSWSASRSDIGWP